MKNLKRVLSFALATAMLVGMMVVGAGAAQFTDGETIENTDAVNTLVALNVINGKDDGSFAPTEVVSRAQMAKMITIALNGGKTPTLPTNAKATYTDIKGHWAEAYIEYCSGLGIVSGRGDGTFDPEGTVTGSEAAKMMLVAMGYPSDVFGFTGANWAINVGIEANKAELFEEIEDIDTSAGLTRDNTAQLIYNGVLAPTMTKKPTQVVGGELSWSYELDEASIFKSKYNGEVFIGTFKDNDKTDSNLKDGYITVNGKLDTAAANAGTGDAKFPADFDIANLGEEVKVLFKDGKGGTPDKPDGDNDTIYGVFVTGTTTTIEATQGDVDSLESEDQKIKIDGTKYSVADSVVVTTNYHTDVAYTGAQLKGNSTTNSALTSALKAANGNSVKAIANSDGEIYQIYVVASKIAVVTAVNAEKVTLNNSVGTLKFEDNEIVEGLKKDDVVVVTTLYNATATDDAALNIVEKAEVVSGTVESYKGTESVTVDGTKYSIYNEAALFTTNMGTDAIANFSGASIDETFDLYLVNGYVCAAVQTSESASNYSLVIGQNDKTNIGGTFGGLQIEVLTADGTKVILTPNDDSKKVAANGTTSTATVADLKTLGNIVTWTGEADDATVTIEYATTATNAYKEKTKSVDGHVVTSSAVFYAETTTNSYTATTGTKFKAYTLRDLADNLTVNKYVLDDNKIVAAFADLNGNAPGATDVTVYGIVSAYNGNVMVDNTEYATYVVENDAETFDVKVKIGTGFANVAKGAIVSFDPANDGLYVDTDFTKLTTEAANRYVAAVKEYNEADGTLTVFDNVTGSAGNYTGNAPKTYAVADDCVIVYFNDDDDEAGAEIGINEFDTVTGYENVILCTEMDGTDEVIIALIVETSGECAIDA